MPDKMPSLQNGVKNGVNKRKESKKPKVDVKAIEKRVLSSTEHLNEIISLNSLVSVCLLWSMLMDRVPNSRLLLRRQLR